MKLRTELVLPEIETEINPLRGVVFMGSCFSNNLGGRYQNLGLPVLCNPFGVIFHPLPLIDILEKSLDKSSAYTPEDLFKHKETFYSLKHHGSFSSENKNELLAKMNLQLEELKNSLENSTALCLTFGTSWGYLLENSVVANCHKLPQKQFKKVITKYDEIETRLNSFLNELEVVFPELKVIITVSPVRHVKDGIIENSLSKANLLLVCNAAEENHSNVHYFPSYEIMIDDLRDYRFYQSDFIHPTELAVDYIQEKFQSWIFSEGTMGMIKELSSFHRFKSHMVKSKNPEVVKSHELSLREKKEVLLHKFTGIQL